MELTADGDAAFERLRTAAVGFDRRLRGDITDEDITGLAHLLDRLRHSVVTDAVGAGAT